MTLDVENLRPRLFSLEAYHCLDELCRFRHVFRHAYTIELDPQRIAIVIAQAQRLKKLYRNELDRFKTFLDTLE